MCAKKDNYYETLYWIESLIDTCMTIQEESNIRKLINEFTTKLLNDKSINPQVFDIFVDRLYRRLNNKFTLIVQEFEVIEYHTV